LNILFDLDGTLTDSYEGITRSICHALTTLGKNPPPQNSLAWCVGPPLRNSLGILLESEDQQLVAEALAAYRERFRTVGIFENRMYRGVPAMLDALQEQRHTLYVATSKPAVFANRIVDYFGLRGYFEHVYGSGLDGALGDKKSLISHILTCEEIDPDETIMVGDREYDMAGARENGIRGVGVLWGYGSREELEASGAWACLCSPGSLISVFK